MEVSLVLYSLIAYKMPDAGLDVLYVDLCGSCTRRGPLQLRLFNDRVEFV